MPPAARSWRPPGGKTRRGLLLAAVAALAVVAAGAGYAALGTGGLAARHYPAARPAGAAFGADAIRPGQGIAQTMGQVASYGDTTVAVGSQAGGDIPRAQFFVSHDDGGTWTWAPVPVSHGATSALAGIAASAAGFVAIRPGNGPAGSPAVRADGVVYVSASGTSWRYVATLTAADGVQLGVVKP